MSIQHDDPAAIVERLDALLLGDGSPEDAMDVSTIDGLMAAALAGPGRLGFEAVLPWVWDADEGRAEPGFASRARAVEIFTLLRQHWLDVDAALRRDDYTPVIYRNASRDGRPGAAVIDEWCRGFLLGLRLQAIAALPPDLDVLLRPVRLYGSEEGWDELDRLALPASEHEAIAAGLGATAQALRRHFRG